MMTGFEQYMRKTRRAKKFGFVKLRYRGLKNATQLFAVRAPVNLYLARKKLLLLAPA